MKLCQNYNLIQKIVISKKSFGRLLLVFCMLLAGAFIGNTSASAADSSIVEYWNFTGNTNTGGISSADLMTLSDGYTGGKYGVGVYLHYYNNQAISGDFSHSTNTTLNGGFSVCYWTRTTDTGGDNRMEVNFGAWGGSLYLGVYNFGIGAPESMSLTENYNNWNNVKGTLNDKNWHHICYTADTSKVNVYYDGTLFYTGTMSGIPSYNISPSSFNYRAGNWNAAADDIVIFNKPLTSAEVTQVYSTESQNISLTPPAPAHSPFDYLWSAFDISKEYQFSLDQNISLNVAYSITWEWDLNPEIDWYLTPVSSEETGRIQLGYSQLLTDDSAFVNYNQPIYDLIDYDFLDQEAEWVITVGEYNMSVEADELIWSEKPFRIHLVGTNWGGQYIKVPDTSLPLIINPDTTSTSTIPFIYKLDNVASSTLENSQICLTSTQGGNTNPSEYCFDVVSSSGSNVLDLPMVFSNGTTNTWRFDLVSSSTVIFRGQEFSIEYFNGSVATSTDVATIFGDTAHNLACTPAEWEDTNEGWLGVNTVISMCVIKESGWKFLDIIISGFQGMFKWLGNQLLSLFPLNIPTKILECWNNAQTAQLNADLTFLIAYETDKSIVGYMPKEWTGTASDTDLVIFSRQQMEQGSTVMATLFDNFKKFTVFFQWALFALGLIAWSKQVYKDLSNNVHKDDDE